MTRSVEPFNRRCFLAGTAAAALGAAAGCGPSEPRGPTAQAAPAPTETDHATGQPSGTPAGQTIPLPDEWGELAGRFIYDGQAPPRRKLTVDKDVECCGKFDIRDESLMVGPEGGLANLYVYLRTRGVPICPALEADLGPSVLLDNRDCIFMPHCMWIWYPRQVFHIVNSDPIAQNVAFSPLGDLPANIVLPPAPNPNDSATWTFRRGQSRPVPIACNYHPWESAYVLPRDNPYVAISNMHGAFQIRSLPPGELEFQLWHERTGELETPQWPRGRLTVKVQPGMNDLGTIRLPPELFAQS